MGNKYIALNFETESGLIIQLIDALQNTYVVNGMAWEMANRTGERRSNPLLAYSGTQP